MILILGQICLSDFNFIFPLIYLEKFFKQESNDEIISFVHFHHIIMEAVKKSSMFTRIMCSGSDFVNIFIVYDYWNYPPSILSKLEVRYLGWHWQVCVMSILLEKGCEINIFEPQIKYRDTFQHTLQILVHLYFFLNIRSSFKHFIMILVHKSYHCITNSLTAHLKQYRLKSSHTIRKTPCNNVNIEFCRILLYKTTISLLYFFFLPLTCHSNKAL